MTARDGVLLTAFLFSLHGTVAPAKDGHGLNLEQPGLIDAVASVLFGYLSQENFTRVDDDTVLVEVTGNFILQLQRLPNQKCSFQSRKLNVANSILQQYNFGQLTGEYRVLDRGVMSTDILLDGEAAWCMKDRGGLNCYNSITSNSGGINNTRKILRAFSFIQANYCPPAKPKRPF